VGCDKRVEVMLLWLRHCGHILFDVLSKST
jgi:hypothetical protein